MKTKTIKFCALFLVALMLLSAFAACSSSDGDTTPGDETKAPVVNPDDSDSGDTSDEDYAQRALDALGSIDYGNRTLGILCDEGHENEVKGLNEIVDASGGTAQVINDAVYLRNQALNKRCKLKVSSVKVSDIDAVVQQEAMGPTREWQFIDSTLQQAATNYATNCYLLDWNELGISLDEPWWDKGTADFVLDGSVYFMSGSLNFADDLNTYVIVFNSDMRETYKETIPDPYQTVRDGEWTLEYFYEVIQGVSQDKNAPAGWGPEDIYGFSATWEYGNTFFIGSGLRYILNDDSVSAPELYLSDTTRMQKVTNVLEIARNIFHDNNATFKVPGGEESLGVDAFIQGRVLFIGEAVMYIQQFNREMDDDYGVLPVPKYNQEQTDYLTWSHGLGSTFSIISTVPTADRETIGDIMSAYAILSHQHLRPVFYDTVLTSRDLRDPESVEMMDMIFANRVYDMAFYFTGGTYGFTFESIFKGCVNDDKDTFNSEYTSASARFDKKIEGLFKALNKNKN